MALRVQIIECADDYEPVLDDTLKADFGPVPSVEFFEALLENSVQSLNDWDTFCDSFVDLLKEVGVLTEEGFTTNGYTVWSIMEISRRGIKMLPLKLQENTLMRIVQGSLKTGMLATKKTKVIQLEKSRLEPFLNNLAVIFERQGLRNPDRAKFIQVVINDAKKQLQANAGSFLDDPADLDL